MASIVLDASAILALLLNEPGAATVRNFIPGAVVSAVNLSEVGARLVDRGAGDSDIRRVAGDLRLEVAPFDQEAAHRAALLRPATRTFGLSLGDRACLALALIRALPVLTTDRLWANLQIGIDIRLARGTT